MEIKHKIKQLASANAEKVIAIRRHLHSHPELSFKEYDTAKYVAAVLKEIGLNPIEGIAGTGVAVLIQGRNPKKKCIALRADMDALPIQETNDIPFKSINDVVMHACGHDVILLRYLAVRLYLMTLKMNLKEL